LRLWFIPRSANTIQLRALARVFAIVQVAFDMTKFADTAGLKNPSFFRSRDRANAFTFSSSAAETEAGLVAMKNSRARVHSRTGLNRTGTCKQEYY
jgi:hypothetical protein